jgi:hypothetical protein
MDWWWLGEHNPVVEQVVVSGWWPVDLLVAVSARFLLK